MNLRRMRCGRITRKGSVLAVALAFVMTLAPAVALAATQLTHGFLRYELEDKSITIVDYAGDEEEVFVPAYIAGNPVNRIAMGAFYDSWTVKKVYLPDTVTNVDEGAFAEDQEVIFQWNAGRGYAEETGDNGNSNNNGNGGSSGNSGTTDNGNGSGSNGSGSNGTGSLGLNGGLIGMPGSGLTYGGTYRSPVLGNNYSSGSSSSSGNSSSSQSGSSTSTPSTSSQTPAGTAGTSTGSSTYSSSSAGSPASGQTAVTPDTNTVRNAGTPASTVVTTAAGSARTPATGDPTSYALPVALVVVAGIVIGAAIVRLRRS